MSGSVLSAGQAAMVLFGTFVALLIVRVPVAFALGLACLPILLIEPRLSMMMLAQETFNAYNSFILLSVPFFLLTANLMSIGGITDRLVALSRAMVGHWPGSLAQINVVLSVFFAGISGSSTADAASQSKIFIDAQTKEGYDLSFSIAITAVSAGACGHHPASILMIVWGGLISTSIAAMYLAGIVPGLLIAGAQMATVHVYAVRRGYPTYPKIELGGDALLALALDSGAGDAVHHRRRHPARLVHGDRVRLRRGAVFDGAVDLLLPGNRRQGALQGLSRHRDGSPASRCSASAPRARSAGSGLLQDSTGTAGQRLGLGHGTDRGGLLHLVLLSGGRLLPRCHSGDRDRRHRAEPLARSVDLHPVQFAIISIVSLAFGLVTPPYGLCLMIACAVAGVRLRYALKDTAIMLVPMLVVLAALIVWPEVSLFLPRLIVPEMLK
jgi:TRAP-type uncharacterized transport system fused permease subunit